MRPTPKPCAPFQNLDDRMPLVRSTYLRCFNNMYDIISTFMKHVRHNYYFCQQSCDMSWDCYDMRMTLDRRPFAKIWYSVKSLTTTWRKSGKLPCGSFDFMLKHLRCLKKKLVCQTTMWTQSFDKGLTMKNCTSLWWKCFNVGIFLVST